VTVLSLTAALPAAGMGCLSWRWCSGWVGQLPGCALSETSADAGSRGRICWQCIGPVQDSLASVNSLKTLHGALSHLCLGMPLPQGPREVTGPSYQS